MSKRPIGEDGDLADVEHMFEEPFRTWCKAMAIFDSIALGMDPDTVHRMYGRTAEEVAPYHEEWMRLRKK